MAFGVPGYEPRNPTYQGIAPPVHRDAELYDAASFGRPAFYNSTIEYMFGTLPCHVIRMPDGQDVPLYKDALGRWHTREAFDIDHENDWADFVESTRPETVADAKRAYNDVENLRIFNSTANRSRDFNVDRHGEFLDRARGELPRGPDDDDFIDDSQVDPEEDARAFRELRAHIDEMNRYVRKRRLDAWQDDDNFLVAKRARDASDSAPASDSESAVGAGDADAAGTAADAGSAVGTLEDLAEAAAMLLA